MLFCTIDTVIVIEYKELLNAQAVRYVAINTVQSSRYPPRDHHASHF